MTQTLKQLQQLRSGAPGRGGYVYDDDMPEDIDAFRLDLARRINAFVASRTGEENSDGDVAPQDDSEAR
jgi:hypothetical protein